MKRVIVDVDVGTDDAVALLLLLAADEKKIIKIEAITCTNGNTSVNNVVKNVFRLLIAAKRTDIPVYKGAHEPLILPNFKPNYFHGTDGFGDLGLDEPDTSSVKEEIAACAIGKLVTENPGDIYLIALGPLTNVALTIKLFPSFTKSLKEFHLMGGNHKAVGNTTRTAEFNFCMDPEAAHIVLEKLTCPIYILTWEATLDSCHNLSMDWRKNELGLIKNPILELINLAEEAVYPKNQTLWLPCDALLVGAFLYPDKMIIKQSNYHACIELHGLKTRGQVVLDHLKEEDDNVVIIEQIDENIFKEIVLDSVRTIKSS